MTKKFLLALGAAVIAASATAATYKAGEAHVYTFGPDFSWDYAGTADGNAQYPSELLRGQASIQEGFGCKAVWFAQNNFGEAPVDSANRYFGVVADPFNAGQHALRMYSTRWDAFGNFNFALPQVGEPCRVRVVYRVDESVANPGYAEGAGKPFHIKLMDDADQDTPDYPEITEFNYDFWGKPGWRSAEFVTNLEHDHYYLSLLFDGGGLSCGKKVPFFVKEVSVVPVSKLAGYTAPADNKALTITAEMPELVTLEGASAPAGDAYEKGQAFCYNIDQNFQWFAKGHDEVYQNGGVQYPSDLLKGQASIEEGFGAATVWFAQNKYVTLDGTAEGDKNYMEVAPDPYNAGEYALLMLSKRWDAFGNFNFALPEVNKPCRIRVVYRVDENATNSWYTVGDGKKPFAIKLMDDADQDTPDYPELTEDNALFWTTPGWRSAEFVSNLEHDHYYLSLLWNAAGLSCQRNVPFYVKEVSVVPVENLAGYVAPADNKAITVSAEMPALVKVNTGAGVSNVTVDENAPVEFFNLQGVRVANPENGLFIRRQGNKVTKVVIR